MQENGWKGMRTEGKTRRMAGKGRRTGGGKKGNWRRRPEGEVTTNKVTIIASTGALTQLSQTPEWSICIYTK